MSKKLAEKLFGSMTALAVAASAMVSTLSFAAVNDDGTYTIESDDREELLGFGASDEMFLGVAAQFSVFVRNDFSAHDSDAEGRLAAGGSANLGDDTPNYSVGAKYIKDPNAAHVVIGGGELRNFQTGDRNFVVSDDTNISQGIMTAMNAGDCKIYRGELIDFDAAFAHLEKQSRYLSHLDDNANVIIQPYFDHGWEFSGNNELVNVVTLTEAQAAQLAADDLCFEFNVRIPEGSKLVVNIPGNDVTMPFTNVKVYYNDVDYSLEENEPLMGENLPILYNLYEAEKLTFQNSIQGSILAPNADAGDTVGDRGGHIAGSTMVKSFDGNIQFGYTCFDIKADDIVVKTDMQISKTDVNGSEVKDAVLTLTGKDADGDTIIFSEGSLNVAEDGQSISASGATLAWKSGSAPTDLKNIPDGIYILHEEAAPNGFLKASDIEFTVDQGKVVTIDGSPASENLVTMVDELSVLTINKFEITGQKELAGAKLEVLDLAGNVVELNGEKLEWISEAGKTWEIAGIPDGSYTLRESGDTFEYDGKTYSVITTTLQFTVEEGKIISNNGNKTSLTDGAEGYYVNGDTISVCDAEAPEPTEAPETEAPETEAPETEAPETEAPETEAPETEAPETEAPETEAPETEAPETEAPETEAPETTVPEIVGNGEVDAETTDPETTVPETTVETTIETTEETTSEETAVETTIASTVVTTETTTEAVTTVVTTVQPSSSPGTGDSGVTSVMIAFGASALAAVALALRKKQDE